MCVVFILRLSFGKSVRKKTKFVFFVCICIVLPDFIGQKKRLVEKDMNIKLLNKLFVKILMLKSKL